MKRYLAEMVGTFVLVFGGVGSAVLAGDVIGPAGVAAAFGLSVLAMAYAVGPISGAHLNPAVTLGIWMARRMPGKDVSGYVGAQLAGALLACLTLYLVAGGAPGTLHLQETGFGANGYGEHSPDRYSMAAAFLSEVVLTGILVFTVLGTTASKGTQAFAGLAIGLVLTLIHLVGIPVTNVSVNPARSIAPALFVGGWALQQVWMFILAPLVGAAGASLLWTAVWEPAEAHAPAAEPTTP